MKLTSKLGGNLLVLASLVISAHTHQDMTVPLSRSTRDVHSGIRYIELSHPLNNETLHWPGNRGIKISLDIDEDAPMADGSKYHARSDSVDMATHTGTHLDAPSHFAKDGWTVDKIPIDHLIDVPVKVIDLSVKVKANKTYSFLKSDFQDEKGNSLVQPASVVLVYTGISELYDQGYLQYIGMESNPKQLYHMKSPGYSQEAAKYLVEQKIYGVGLDAISADSSITHKLESYNPVAHIEFNKNNVYILENVNRRLKELVSESTARLTIAPLPFTNGTGSPIRLVATLGHDHCHRAANGAKGINSFGLATLTTMLFCSLVFFI